jgi:hypothetical protein
MTTCERDVRLNVRQLRLSDLVKKKKTRKGNKKVDGCRGYDGH